MRQSACQLAALFAASLVALSACDVISGLSDFRVNGGVGGEGLGGAANVGGSGPTTSTTSAGGAGGAGGTGGQPTPELVDEGLLARWFFDDVDPNGGIANDSVAGPGTPLQFMPEGNATVAEGALGDGVNWEVPGAAGRLQATDPSALLTVINGQPTLMLELVLEQVTGFQDASRIFHLGMNGGNGRISLVVASNEFALRIDGQRRVYWPVSVPADGRQVFQFCIDLDEVPVAQLYVDGSLLAPSGQMSSVNVEWGINPATHGLILGNRADGTRSIRGTISYAAIYRACLSSADRTKNVLRLQKTDDAQ